MISRPARLAGLSLPGALLLAFCLPAAAQSAVETSLKAWVASIDASPDWAASYTSVVTEPGGRATVLTGLTIKPERDATVSVSFQPIRVAGYTEPAGGGFNADEISTPGGTLTAPGITMQLGAIKLTGIGLPTLTGFAFDKDKPFSSMVKAYAVAAKARLAQGTVDNIGYRQTVNGVTSTFGYSNVSISRLADGKIDSFTAGPMTLDAPSQEGLVRMTADRIEAQHFDLGALVHVYDTDQYAGGTGDGEWRSVVGTTGYRNLTIDTPTGRLLIASVTAEDFKVRQPPKSFAPFFDAIMANPDMPRDQSRRLAADHMPNFFWSMGIGRLSIDGMDVANSGFDRFRIGQFYIRNLSADGLAEISLGDLGLAVTGEGAVDLSRLVFGDISFPKLATIRAAMAASDRGDDVDPAPLLPKLGFFEVRDLAVSVPQQGSFSMERSRLDLGGYVGPVPTAIDLDLRGLNIDVASIQDPDARKILSDLGYDRITSDYGFRVRWDEASKGIAISDFRIGLKDIGRITADVQLAGLARSALEHLSGLDNAIQQLLFVSARFTVEDQSMFDRVMSMMAKRSNLSSDQYKQQISGALPFFLLLLKNPDFQTKLAPALQAFIKMPGKLVINARPVNPVPMVTLMNTAQNNPERLPNLLTVDVTQAP